MMAFELWAADLRNSEQQQPSWAALKTEMRSGRRRMCTRECMWTNYVICACRLNAAAALHLQQYLCRLVTS
jgi:hypothetical protein